MGSIQILEQRIALLEDRLNELEGAFGHSIHQLNRDMVRASIVLARIADHLGVSATVTDVDFDAVLSANRFSDVVEQVAKTSAELGERLA